MLTEGEFLNKTVVKNIQLKVDAQLQRETGGRVNESHNPIFTNTINLVWKKRDPTDTVDGLIDKSTLIIIESIKRMTKSKSSPSKAVVVPRSHEPSAQSYELDNIIETRMRVNYIDDRPDLDKPATLPPNLQAQLQNLPGSKPLQNPGNNTYADDTMTPELANTLISVGNRRGVEYSDFQKELALAEAIEFGRGDQLVNHNESDSTKLTFAINPAMKDVVKTQGIIVYGADRDWVNNYKSRTNFTVVFNGTVFGIAPQVDNVTSFKINQLILPSYSSIENPSDNSVNVTMPYQAILLTLDGIPHQKYSGDANNAVTSVMIPKQIIRNDVGRTLIVYEQSEPSPITLEQPIPQLKSLSFKLTNPRGLPLNNTGDGNNPVSHMTVANKIMTVTMVNTFTKDQFSVGDIVTFSNITLSKLGIGANASAIDTFNQLINDETGFTITNLIAGPNVDRFNNRLYTGFNFNCSDVFSNTSLEQLNLFGSTPNVFNTYLPTSMIFNHTAQVLISISCGVYLGA